MELGTSAIKAIGQGLLLPGLIALLVLALLDRAGKRWMPLAGLAAPVALSASFCAASWSRDLVPFWPTKTGAEWLPAVSLAAIPAGWFCSRGRRPEIVLFILASTAFAVSVPMIPGYVTIRLGHAVWTFVLGESIIILALALQRAAAEFSAPLFAALLAICGLGQAAILMLSGSASLAEMSGIQGAAFAGIALSAFLIIRGSDPSLTRGAIPGFAILSTGLMSRNFYAADGGWDQSFNFVALLAPLGLLSAAWPPLKRLPGRIRTILAITVMAALLALATFLAYRASAW